MRAEPGAIYDVSYDKKNFIVQTIENKPARGICGSGLFHLIFALYKLGYIDCNGRICTQKTVDSFKYGSLKINDNGMRSIQLVTKKEGASREILLTQADIREFQLAKSAITSAWKILCKEMTCNEADIKEVYIAGAFGNFIRPQIALEMGLVPPVGLNQIHFIGNAALEGARMLILNKAYLKNAQMIAKETKFIELAGRADFQEAYIQNLSLANNNKTTELVC
jgi:uncharacterized 2Fe-2S/4Fe-4S cluster protein (DUF4445 family)